MDGNVYNESGASDQDFFTVDLSNYVEPSDDVKAMIWRETQEELRAMELADLTLTITYVPPVATAEDFREQRPDLAFLLGPVDVDRWSPPPFPCPECGRDGLTTKGYPVHEHGCSLKTRDAAVREHLDVVRAVEEAQKAAAEPFTMDSSFAQEQMTRAYEDVDLRHTLNQITRERAVRAAKRFVDAEEGRAAGDSIDEIASKLVTGSSFIRSAPEGIPAIWGDGDRVLHAVGEALIVVGPPGTGKSTLAGQIVEKRILGGDLLGLTVRKLEPGEKILYLACDRPKQIQRLLARRLRGLTDQQLNDHLVFWEGPPPGDFAKDPMLLTRLCQAAGASSVIVDSLKDVAVGLVGDDVGAQVNISRQNALAAGVDVIELHHQRKSGGPNGEKPKTLADVYGSGWITAGAGSVLLLWGVAGDREVELIHLKQPGEVVGPFKVVHDHTAGTSTVSDRVDLVALARDAVAGGALGISAKDAAVLVFRTGSPDKGQVEKGRRALDALAGDDGPLELTREGARGGGCALWGPPANHESNHAVSGGQITVLITGADSA